MLVELNIKHYALIDNITLEFGSGLNVLTGETGAGKSIITKAIEFISGCRASPTIIKSSAEYAMVEASFDISSMATLQANLFDWGIERDNEVLIIRRIISRENRKSRAWINDQLVTVRQLQEISKELISFAGQHEQQTLLNPENHLEMLDTFGNYQQELKALQEVYEEIKKLENEIEHLNLELSQLQRKTQNLNKLHDELIALNPQPGEGSDLKQKLDRLKHAAFLYEKAREAYAILYENNPCVHDLLAIVEKNLAAINELDPTAKNVVELVSDSIALISEASLELQKYYQDIIFDPAMLSAVEGRLNQFRKMAERLDCSVDELHLAKERIEAELNQLSELEFRRTELEKTIQKLWSEYTLLAEKLSAKRKYSSKTLAQRVTQKLMELDMPRAKFKVELIEREEPSIKGMEKAIFLFSANPGEPLKPLNEVVSGGELSRIFLVLKSLVGKSVKGSTIIFDEIDTGMGAGTAKLVGKMLKELSRRNQIICITHQASIAAMASHHFHVEKELQEKHVMVRAKKLNTEERVTELSRMLAGSGDIPDIRKHAEAMLQESHETTA